MKRIFIFIAAWTLSSSSVLAATPPAKIGRAVEVENIVDLITRQGAYEVIVGTNIHTLETVTTGTNSSSQFTMNDDTRLAVGPSSQLVLDKFVYDPNPGKRKLILSGLRGAIRFVTGTSPSNTYTINTPTAAIGVRGTMFDIYIDDVGKTVIGLLDGKVNVCSPRSNRCRELNRPGRFIAIDHQGRIRNVSWPDRTMLGNVPFATAFPFLGGTRRLYGKLAVPQKIRRLIRQKAGLEPTPRKRFKRKVKNRRIYKRKATKRRVYKRRIVRRDRRRPVRYYERPRRRVDRPRIRIDLGLIPKFWKKKPRRDKYPSHGTPYD